mmetsp:Transcript_29409/g.47189  ORF Transcript_29409/g.47189 Transcript_29409/m.47189 type:complete len:304 (+) Transcript_29409:536-1447(+)
MKFAAERKNFEYCAMVHDEMCRLIPPSKASLCLEIASYPPTAYEFAIKRSLGCLTFLNPNLRVYNDNGYINALAWYLFHEEEVVVEVEDAVSHSDNENHKRLKAAMRWLMKLHELSLDHTISRGCFIRAASAAFRNRNISRELRYKIYGMVESLSVPPTSNFVSRWMGHILRFCDHTSTLSQKSVEEIMFVLQLSKKHDFYRTRCFSILNILKLAAHGWQLKEHKQWIIREYIKILLEKRFDENMELQKQDEALAYAFEVAGSDKNVLAEIVRCVCEKSELSATQQQLVAVHMEKHSIDGTQT